MNTNLWGGRFDKPMEHYTAAYNASIFFDNALFEYSIDASKAHAAMLEKQKIITSDELSEINRGLEIVRKKLEKGEIAFDVMDEDIMMTVEKYLTEEIGSAGKRLHTARSRNDQNVVDETLYLRHVVDETKRLLKELLATLVDLAEQGKETAMPGFTHLQHAQPMTVGFYYMAHFQGLRRDYERFSELRRRVNQNPLGACAMAGTTLPIDRWYTTRLLGFDAPTENALDTVGNRDNIAEFCFDAALTMVHLSGFAEELIVFNSQEFRFIDIDDSFCTGSSIMPQKKNPDIAELARGKSSRTIGNLVSILTMLKGTFLTLNKDYQEDKERLFDSVETLHTTLYVFAHMLRAVHFKPEVLRRQLEKGFITATDIAEYLVQCGVPFRDAHHLVGGLVKYCESCGKDFPQVTKAELRSLGITQLDDLSRFTIDASIRNRKSWGGVAPEEVERQIQVAKDVVRQAE